MKIYAWVDAIQRSEQTIFTGLSRQYSQAWADDNHRPEQMIFTCSSSQYSQAQADNIHMLKQMIFTGPSRRYSHAQADNIHRLQQTIYLQFYDYWRWHIHTELGNENDIKTIAVNANLLKLEKLMLNVYFLFTSCRLDDLLHVCTDTRSLTKDQASSDWLETWCETGNL